jgi:hypothetical protein
MKDFEMEFLREKNGLRHRGGSHTSRRKDEAMDVGSYTCYDKRDRRLLVYGGWNNGWFGDIYTLNVSKIIGPPYAITGSEPDMSQLTGGVKVRIFGRGFKEFGPKVLFTCGNRPIDN